MLNYEKLWKDLNQRFVDERLDIIHNKKFEKSLSTMERFNFLGDVIDIMNTMDGTYTEPSKSIDEMTEGYEPQPLLVRPITSDRFDEDSKEAYDVAELMCISCKHRWIGVYHSETALKELECPNCRAIGFAIRTGQNMAIWLDLICCFCANCSNGRCKLKLTPRDKHECDYFLDDKGDEDE